MQKVGDIPMPAAFRYREIFYRGKPRHSKTDPFRIRHPSMDLGRRAKLFSPFDALKGFSSAVSAKNELYESRRELNEEDLQELERRLHILKGRCPARIRATFYVPCQDENSEAWGKGGQYRTLSGTCLKVDEQIGRCLLMEEERISFSDLYCLESEDGLFDEGPEAF
ncbi:MAG: hypothetical protein II189_06315 [Lachnospiraceae bacterium]|nr:hypothetical protein [Lachnospiraceae bacterium]MBQ3973023.1 hypothetical protein [Lachnospiraceae bacterium]